MQVVRPYNLDEYFLNLLKNIYKNKNLSTEVGKYYEFVCYNSDINFSN